MRALSDKWNSRLWLREWLNQPSKAELVERQVAEAATTLAEANGSNFHIGSQGLSLISTEG